MFLLSYALFPVFFFLSLFVCIYLLLFCFVLVCFFLFSLNIFILIYCDGIGERGEDEGEQLVRVVFFVLFWSLYGLQRANLQEKK